MAQDEGLYAYMNNMYGTNYGQQQQQQQPVQTNTSTGLWSGFKKRQQPNCCCLLFYLCGVLRCCYCHCTYCGVLAVNCGT